MKKILIIVDMQNDFIDGSLGTPEAQKIVPSVREKIRNFDGSVIFTRDAHDENYMETQEGRKLPVLHCIKDTYGWQIHGELDALRKTAPIDKGAFGSYELGALLRDIDREVGIESIEFAGVCTDICVICNVMLAKAFVPDVPLIVDASCCAGVTVESHETALKAMQACQVEIRRG